MFDYRNNLKRILQNTAGDEKSLKNGLAAIKTVLQMKGNEDGQTPVSTDDEEVELVRNLLDELTRLLQVPGDEVAKDKAISNIHKLTFVKGVAKNYGKQLSKLELAINKSITTKEAINSKIFRDAVTPKKQAIKDYRKGRRYTVIRLVSGAELINDNGEVVYTVKESQVHPLNLKSGDIVEALEDKQNPNYEAEILRVVGYRKLRTRDYDQIEDFKYAVVQGKAGQLAITRNINGQKLKIRGKNVVIPVDSSYYQGENIHLEDGSIVDLAWYTGDVRLKKNPADAVQIRWIYQTEAEKRAGVKKKTKEKTESEQNLTKLDLDLHYQRVGIAVGDNQNEQMLEGIVQRYNGIPIPINAFDGKKKAMERQIKELDLVILVTAFAAHDATWNIREFASKYGVKFAVSSSKGYQSFERALYRAANGLPAYEGTQTIKYEVQDQS
ncbi:DUF2325 domain-containing protein [Lactobacillus gigeriorum]|uniref:V-type sodium ATP synthase subunit n=1 Tax=Lactobacillus gigeriorum DSM 23908 = CRBIP 24.85 TaxID=1423751 RepID=I7JZA8_9LACO|nr:DUF2325 domain-containing protein [Lactobacillus gigeriorum]KRN14120.1 V-type sodium ATP synthase subunit [Lactobacillus gigeriorum DSM 23908 = CRBIP 24.85]CCI86145.1 Probable V-type sodium ATP synthase subunit [Lactobacillus gigeriorum DSM 23908 = CRBIP 24.85]